MEITCCSSSRCDLSIKSSSIRTNSIIVAENDKYNFYGFGTYYYSFLSYRGVVKKTGKETSGITTNYIKI